MYLSNNNNGGRNADETRIVRPNLKRCCFVCILAILAIPCRAMPGEWLSDEAREREREQATHEKEVGLLHSSVLNIRLD